MAPQLPDIDISIYAELLENIRQVSVVATLKTLSDPSTKAWIDSDGTVIKVEHHGRAQSMTLPAQAMKSSSLPVPQKPSKQLRWRIPLSSQVQQASSFSLENQALPWNAVDIKVESAIRCRACHHEIVEEGAIKTWKDLPSENWAEMMEFWHCHKPLNHSQADENHLTKRGYGASNAISSQPSTGFVDITSLMFSESDCNGLTVSCSCLML